MGDVWTGDGRLSFSTLKITLLPEMNLKKHTTFWKKFISSEKIGNMLQMRYSGPDEGKNHHTTAQSYTGQQRILLYEGEDFAMAGKTRIVLLCLLLMLFMAACTVQGFADDAEMLKDIPGTWTCTDEVQEENGEIRMADAASLMFEEDGKFTMRCNSKEGEPLYSCEGTWTFELVPDGMDHVTLLFTTTDNPAKAGSEYRVECLYTAYEESWEENDVRYTYLILEPVRCSGVSPFEELTGYDGAALHREQSPNMKVVNCKDYVSLRSKPSKSSARLAKVPLGALVLTAREPAEENGFILCCYHDEYGYILSEYLEPVK